MATNNDLYMKIKEKLSNSQITAWLMDIDHVNQAAKPAESSYRLCIKKCSDTYHKLQKSKSTLKGSEAFNKFLNSQIQFPKASKHLQKPKASELPCTSSSNCSYKDVTLKFADENKSLFEKQNELAKEIDELKRSKISRKTLVHIKDSLKNKKKLVKCLETRIKLKDKVLKKVRIQNNRYIQKINRLTNKIEDLMVKNEQLHTLNSQQDVLLTNTTQELKNRKEELINIENERDWLAEIIEESSDVNFYSDGKFSFELRQCIYSLLSLNVSAQSVPGVINSVLTLLGKKCNKLPSRSTILNMNVERLILSQKQLAEVIPSKDNLTLYTDETTKFGVKYSGYHVSDQEGSMYVLGMRQLETKSAANTLAAFQEILSDIEEKTIESNPISKNILFKITSTMSDRASTEKKFNRLLEELRAGVLPELIQNWNNLSIEEQKSASSLLNFFCGLHSLVHFAEVCNASLIQLENAHFSGQPPIFDKSFMKVSESSVVRLIRTTCKALARGADEKSGKYNDFNTFVTPFLKENKLHSIPLEEFRGNRFNILFESAAGVFFLKDQISEFLTGCQTNKLLKAVQHDVKVPMFMAEVKSLGLISRLITGPLWSLLEDRNIHILDMNKYYLQLVNFFNDAQANIEIFMKGKLLPFGETTVVKNDALLTALLIPCWQYDYLVVVCLSVLLPALCKLAKKIFTDHLPGGRWENVTDDMRLRSSGTAKHNKFSESVFGYLDNLLRMKPNISVLATEAFVMFSSNKTHIWLESRTNQEKDQLINEAVRGVSKMREEFKKRTEIIKANQKRKIEESILQAEAIEAKRLERLEGYSQKIIYYGLWQSESEVDRVLNEIKTKTEKIQALKAQLNFRKYVLKQNPKDQSCYSLSTDDNGVKRKLTIDEIKTNVVKLVRHAFTVEQAPTSDTNLPILTGKRVKHCFDDNGERKWWTGQVISQVTKVPYRVGLVYFTVCLMMLLSFPITDVLFFCFLLGFFYFFFIFFCSYAFFMF